MHYCVWSRFAVIVLQAVFQAVFRELNINFELLCGCFAERVGGINLFQQLDVAPVPIALTFLAITVASLVPQYRGVKRSGSGFWTPDAELWNGRAAMIGMVAVVLNTWVRGSVF